VITVVQLAYMYLLYTNGVQLNHADDRRCVLFTAY